MPIPRRLATALASLFLASATAACGAAEVATPTASPTPPPPPSPASTVGAAAFGEAICPIFDDIVQLDPRLMELRDAGEAGEDVEEHSAEIDAVTEKLRTILNDLEALPTWEPAGSLRLGLITSLHAIRTHLLLVGEEPRADDAAAHLAATPFVASEAMDRGFAQATEAGLTCAPDR